MNSRYFWRELQSEVGAWSQRNFPNAKPYQPLLGVQEELGELVEAHSQFMTRRVGRIDIEDALADLVIFLADYCERNSYSMRWRLAEPARPIEGLQVAVGRLAHAHLKTEQGIRGNERELESLAQKSIEQILCYAHDYASVYGIDFYRCIDDTWRQVKRRDWQKYPDTGLPPAQEAADDAE